MYAARTAGKVCTTGDFVLSSHSNLGVAKGVTFSSDCSSLSSDTPKCERLERITKVRLWEALGYDETLVYENREDDLREVTIRDFIGIDWNVERQNRLRSQIVTSKAEVHMVKHDQDKN